MLVEAWKLGMLQFALNFLHFLIIHITEIWCCLEFIFILDQIDNTYLHWLNPLDIFSVVYVLSLKCLWLILT